MLEAACGRYSPTLTGRWFDDGFHGTMAELLVAVEDRRRHCCGLDAVAGTAGVLRENLTPHKELDGLAGQALAHVLTNLDQLAAALSVAVAPSRVR